MSRAPDGLFTVRDYELAAREALERGVFGYLAGGAGDEWTLRENRRAFRRWALRPRVLVDVSSVTTEATVLGAPVSLPVLVAPTAYQRLAHPDGELAMARAAAGIGTVMCLSTFATASAAEVADAAPDGRRWFQLYWYRDRGVTRTLVEQAADAGFSALVLTVDLPELGRRERDLRSGFEVSPDLPVASLALAGETGSDLSGAVPLLEKSLTWRDLEWLRSIAPLPLVLKGLLTREDAQLACDHGADGIVVSNHGGRQLDGAPASLDALPEVVEAVSGRAAILLDGGVRRGVDVVKALALGADAVLAGRACLWGLAVGGEEGARRVLELLRAEILLALQLLGCSSPAHLGAAHVSPAARLQLS